MFEKYSFKELKKEIARVNPVFARLVEETKGAQDCTLYLAEYRYGDLIVDRGDFKVPNKKGGLISLHDAPKQVKADLGYNLMTNPITMALDKTQELYMELPDKVIPHQFYKPGEIYGFSSILATLAANIRSPSAINIWSVSAGARNTAILPPINEIEGLNALMRKYDFVSDKPKRLINHWNLLREIGRCDENWRCRVLYFSSDWYKKLKEKSWMALRIYFSDHFNAAMQFYTFYAPWNISFALAQNQKKILAPTAVNETVKYLLGIASGFLIGHKLAVDDVEIPLSFIQEALKNIYAIREYAPLLMVPSKLESQPVYYSLQYPMQPSSIELDSSRSTIKRHDDLYNYFSRYIKEFTREGSPQVSDTPLMQAIREVSFDFIHRDTERFPYMHDTIDLEKMADFKQALAKTGGRLAVQAKYFNGAVRISRDPMPKKV